MDHEDRRVDATPLLQSIARGRALHERVDRLERAIARVGARLDGAAVTLLPAPDPLDPRGGS
jgi:hypothetical protein